MEETINVRTVARYFETAILYGTKEIETACLNWLKVNLLSHLPEHPEYLRNISINLMEKLIKSPDLFVMQTEFSVYVLLRYAIRVNLVIRFRSYFYFNSRTNLPNLHLFVFVFQAMAISYFPPFMERRSTRCCTDVS